MLDQGPAAPVPESKNAAAIEQEIPWCEKHHQIVRDEIAAINTRREPDRRIDPDRFESCQLLDVTGLALSGGGIRSSALCLGVLQALNHHNLIGRIDYLSTVSGGGYIGTSLSATMTAARRFVFGERPVGGTVTAAEISDTPSVGHLRNYSNYLIPAGARDLLTGIAIVVRGLTANIGLTLPIVLLLAAVTVWSTPLRSCLTDANVFGVSLSNRKLCELHNFSSVDRYGFSTFGAAIALVMFLCSALTYFASRSVRGSGPSVVLAYIGGLALLMGVACDFARLLQVHHFALTLAMAIIGAVLFFGWALKQSFASPQKRQEFRSHWPSMGATFLVLLAVIAFFEFQPFMLEQMFDVAESNAIGGPAAGVAIIWIKSLAAAAAPIGVFVTAFRQQFAELLKGNGASSQWASLILKIVAKVALWIAGLALPLIIWVAYLYLSYWGISNDLFEQCSPDLASQRECVANAKSNAPSGNLAGRIQFDAGKGTLSAEITPKAAPPVADRSERLTPTWHTPAWLEFLAEKVGPVVQVRFPDLFKGEASELAYSYSLPKVILYMFAGAMLFAISFCLTPNANSLHRLYRDRLSKAFLFDPTRSADGGVGRAEASLDQGRDFRALDRMKLTDLYAVPAEAARIPGLSATPKLHAPYQLINTALNIQGSDFANRRGRNADFFLFSALNVGSEATGYAPTGLVQDDEQSLDLATAMAISGAAASSNMGSSSIKALTPTLALLNVRLGYWLKNPRYVDERVRPQRRSTPLYFWSEISGRLYENSDSVYLTDGGHIENLGVYELLRRRCRLIIAVDAEADAPMNFGSLMTLQRYARIDLGVRIDLPWTPIRERTRALMARNADKAGDPAAADDHDEVVQDHVHVAIGTIDYGGDEKGYLVYIKSSLNGDENDYIRDYARRNDRFPHETTGDQFFSEEQFEVYRALGFHMTHGFLSGDHPVAVGSGIRPRTVRFTAAGEPAVDAVRQALGLVVLQRRTASVAATMIDQE
ncbi:cell division protein [Bradyrhizobium sacchari]|uniref:Patatin-like phospholipase n=1 Tax=Bradyrhizobium sacchari TaxID=1399419 RepID=A0A560JGY0_9BRAD|nr:cell division protein [Bradyrhizobium sacchari]OPY95119.1 cell division protein [Bradyrhizobium sacchari]TWB49728.1 patatin-like phospholipase [Bradyrhizobium sacchari]TWB68614.1 patatin-like phospholipase [Bradyrhizobium sacchari]